MHDGSFVTVSFLKTSRFMCYYSRSRG